MLAKCVAICAIFGLAAADAGSAGVSPVQKVIEMLSEYKVKVQADLDAEAKEMTEYVDYCDKESSERTYAIKTATREIAELTSTIQDGTATVAKLDDDIATLGSVVAGKESELAAATAERKSENADFKASEAELVTSVDQLERAIVMIKRGTNEMAFLQGAKGVKGSKKDKKDPNADIKLGLSMISKVLDAGWVNEGTKKSLKAMLQTNLNTDDKEDAGLTLNAAQPQPTVSAYESHSGGIVGQIEEMKEKAEDVLSNARNSEMKEQHNFDMMAQSLTDAIKINKEKTSEAKSLMATTKEETGKAKGELTETTKSKAADTKFLETLTMECQETAAAWEDRQKAAAGEMGALDKAKEILASKVKVLIQIKKSPADISEHWNDMQEASDEASKDLNTRHKIEKKLKALQKKFPSYGLMQLVSQVGQDPFEKVKGLITDMITKLVNEANAEATQKQFCDEEMAKSTEVKDDKSMTLDKLQSRLDKAATTKAKLEQLIGELSTEIAELDAGTAEATKIRTAEQATYVKASADYKMATEAVQQAIGVLKEYYESVSLVQTKTSKAAQPSFGGAKSDAASTIISILEMCEENFSKLYTETETGETSAKMAYDKLMLENKVAKTAKTAEIKGSESEIKSLDVTLRNSKEDFDMTTKELDAVMAYMEKLKPQCETKVMSYAEKKAAREAEIEGLKEALSILDTEALVQIRHFRARVH